MLHIDTGHNFIETIDFRNDLVKDLDTKLIVGSVQESIDKGRAKEETGADASRNSLQIVSLLDTLEQYKIDAAMGGARRDEEKARAKERFFSHRDEFGQWDPKNQRPELWNLFNGRKNKFLRIGRSKGFMSNLNELSSLNSDKSNFNHVFKSKKIFVAGVGLTIFVIGLILFFL